MCAGLCRFGLFYAGLCRFVPQSRFLFQAISTHPCFLTVKKIMDENRGQLVSKAPLSSRKKLFLVSSPSPAAILHISLLPNRHELVGGGGKAHAHRVDKNFNKK